MNGVKSVDPKWYEIVIVVVVVVEVIVVVVE